MDNKKERLKNTDKILRKFNEDVNTTLKIKDRSKSSFPGDHANFLLLFCFFYGSVVGGPLNKYLYMYASLRSLPRLIVGAHWFSDILVGSLSMTLFCASLLLYTPFRIWALKWIEKNLKKIQIVDHEKKARPLS
ncbi:MAG: phosphatase PAP2 family protein [Leptospiraceae bacterium]|nr:phosphatase PAP2 family protein [Leptospiraceae bacterium]